MRYPLRVGTRASLLALTQTRSFCALLKQQLRAQLPGLEIRETQLTTTGDGTTAPLSQTQTPGLFVNVLREALLHHRVDFIVHSMKDLPAQPHPGIVTACTPARADARDAFVSRHQRTLEQLPPGAVIGTSSPRRAASVLRLRPELHIVNIRGNIDTRIAQVLSERTTPQDAPLDGTLLAFAGLTRIRRAHLATQIFNTHDFVPAPGQGALAIECRNTDTELLELLTQLTHSETQLTTTAERAVLRGLNAGCATAIGAHATYNKGMLALAADLAPGNGKPSHQVLISEHIDPHDLHTAEQLGLRVAQQLLTREHEAPQRHKRETVLINYVPVRRHKPAQASPTTAPWMLRPPSTDCMPHTLPHTPSKCPTPTVLLLRAHRNEFDAQALAAVGIGSVSDPHLVHVTSDNVPGARRLLAALKAEDAAENEAVWLVITSPNALHNFEKVLDTGELRHVITHARHLRFAAIGAQTRSELLRLGAQRIVLPGAATVESLFTLIAGTKPGRVVVPCGDLALRQHDSLLTDSGFTVLREAVYRTEIAAAAPGAVRALVNGSITAVLFRSPSAVRAFVAHHGAAARFPELLVCCAGGTTALFAAGQGFRVTVTAPDPSPETVARSIATALSGNA